MHRLGQEMNVVEADVFALEMGFIAGPEFLEGTDVLVGDRAALLEGRQVQCLKLLSHPAHTNAHHQAPAGQHIQRGQGLGRHQGVAVRYDEYAGYQPDSSRLTRYEGQQGQHFHPISRNSSGKLATHRVWVGRGDITWHYDMIAGVQRVVAQLLASSRHAPHRFRCG